ncbi:MAG: mechanosensitive ion channel family protein [Bacteroidales bacterium]|jgi:MscS family membrane protein|nr:mechanosensitive ion channel family protein [Bacteroidales bacterium]
MEFFERQFYHNTVTDWAISLLIIIGAVIVTKLLVWFIKNIVKKLSAKSKTKIDDLIVDMLEEPLIYIIALGGVWFAVNRLTFTDQVSSYLEHGFWFVVILVVTWFIARLLEALIDEYLTPIVKNSESDIDDQLLPVARKVIKYAIWILGVIIALNNAGFNVAAVLAGLGIGGLALAMAAKDTVANFFGGFTIFTDKPFVLGDRIKVAGYDGIVQEVGLRSTRIKTLAGTILTVPNMKFTDNIVENVSLEPSRKVTLNLGLTYDTPEDKIQLAIDILKDIIAHTEGTEENVPVGFNSFGDFSLGIIFIYYIKKEADILQVQTGVNMQILKRFNENKLEFAFPTQSILAQISK